MSGLKLIILCFIVTLTNIVFATLPFCLESENGLKCWYLSEADCEKAKQNHEYCVVNPEKIDLQDGDSFYLTIPKLQDSLCFQPFCIKDFRELCNQEKRRDDISPGCTPGY